MVRDARAKVSIFSPCATGFAHRVGPSGGDLRITSPPPRSEVSAQRVSSVENRQDRTAAVRSQAGAVARAAEKGSDTEA